MGKRLSQLYYIKMKFLMIWVVLQSVSPWQRNDAIMFLLSLCFSVLGVLFKKSLKGVCTCHNCLHYGKVLTDSMRVFLKYLEINNLFTLCVHIASYGCTREVCTKDASSISSMSQVFLQLVVVRRILITCIQLLFFFFLQFLHVIWSIPTNFKTARWSF